VQRHHGGRQGGLDARSILSDLSAHGDELWRRVNHGAPDQLWYYGTVRDVFMRRLPGSLSDELDRTVRAINDLSPTVAQN